MALIYLVVLFPVLLQGAGRLSLMPLAEETLLSHQAFSLRSYLYD